jgi:ribokinase
LGRDEYAESLNRFSKTEDIDLSLEYHSVPTGAASIWVDREGKNRIIVDIGANEYLSESHILQNESNLRSAKVVISQLECNLDSVKLAFELSKRGNNRVTTILNTAPINDSLDKDIFKNVDIVISNESEFDDIMKTFYRTSCVNHFESSMKDMAYDLKLTAMVVTLGERGVIIYDRYSNKFSNFRAPVMNVVDTAGAGDCFCGTFASKLTECTTLNEENLKTVAYMSVLNASLSTMKSGTAPSMPTKSEFSEFKNQILERAAYLG